jgi:hypothetical protein
VTAVCHHSLSARPCTTLFFLATTKNNVSRQTLLKLASTNAARTCPRATCCSYYVYKRDNVPRPRLLSPFVTTAYYRAVFINQVPMPAPTPWVLSFQLKLFTTKNTSSNLREESLFDHASGILGDLSATTWNRRTGKLLLTCPSDAILAWDGS